MKNYELMNETEKLNYLITWKHTGKMENMVSLSTSVLLNENCKAHRNCAGSICENCYAFEQLHAYKTQRVKLERATEFLTSHVVDFDNIPVLNVKLFRFESFGDLNNSIQVINYFNIARKNPDTTFTLFTKNPFIIDYALKEYGVSKPENFIVILSSLFKNHEFNIDKMKALYPFVDKIFTVYTPEYINENGITINCGARNCFTCRKCYDKNNGIEYLHERVK